MRPHGPASEQPLLFDRFYRASGAVSGEVTGTGLGLWIADAIARMHAGTIAVAPSHDKRQLDALVALGVLHTGLDLHRN